MELIKFILITIFSIIIGFGLWYSIFWFFTLEPNLFLWHWAVKVIFLILSVSSSSNIVDGYLKNS
jgi:hypothetical protein